MYNSNSKLVLELDSNITCKTCPCMIYFDHGYMCSSAKQHIPIPPSSGTEIGNPRPWFCPLKKLES